MSSPQGSSPLSNVKHTGFDPMGWHISLPKWSKMVDFRPPFGTLFVRSIENDENVKYKTCQKCAIYAYAFSHFYTLSFHGDI